jgi:diguanylate cyclase (GGDEF)-like protein
MPMNQRRPIALHLAWLLTVAIAGAFVTTLIVVTGDLASFWPLYIVPIVISALSYHVSGAVLSVAFTAAIIALLIYGAGYPVSSMPELLIGLVAYAISGIVIGVQARRYQQQRELLELDSTQDALTGLLRTDHFQTRLAEEVRRSARYATRCSCSLIEIPGFAEFRRKYGRIKADLMLERLADVLRLTVRNTDAIGRQGEACFALILPSTNTPQAVVVGDRIREAVASTQFEGDALEPTAHVDVEIAIATYPDDAGDAAEMLRVATEHPHYMCGDATMTPEVRSSSATTTALTTDATS